MPNHEDDGLSLLDQLRYRRNQTAAFVGLSLVCGGVFVVHEVQNGGKADFLAGVGAVLTASTAGYGIGNFNQYRKLRQKQRTEQEE